MSSTRHRVPVKTVQRALLRGPRDLIFEDVALKSELAPGELYAETLYSALSIGTELAAYTGLPPLRDDVRPFPRLLGYCNVAVIRKTGPAVHEYQEGDFILTTQSHQSAFICSEAEVLSSVSPDLNPQNAALAYLAYLGAVSLRKANYQPGEWVTVMGLGPIGLATLKWLACSDARVIALGRRASRLELARQSGVALCLDSGDPASREAVLEMTGGHGSEIVVTTLNDWNMWRLALEIARPHGRIAVLGFPGRGQGAPTQNPLESSLFYVKQLNLLACGQVDEWGSRGADPVQIRRELIGSILSLMQQGKLDLSGLVSEVVPFHQLEAMYGRAESDRENFLTALLRWPAAEEFAA